MREYYRPSKYWTPDSPRPTLRVYRAGTGTNRKSLRKHKKGLHYSGMLPGIYCNFKKKVIEEGRL